MYGGWVSGQGDEKLIHEINTNVNGGRSITYINTQKSINNYANIELSYGISYSIQEKNTSGRHEITSTEWARTSLASVSLKIINYASK